MSERGFVRSLALVDSETRARRVGIAFADYLTEAEKRTRFDALCAAHRRAAGDGVPDVVGDFDLGPGRGVVLASEARIDGSGLITRLEAKGVRFPPDAASALLERVAAILMRVHELHRTDGGEPIVLGVLEPRNILFHPNGTLEVMGFGLAPWALDNCPMVPVAPELATQRPITAKVDVFATFCFAQAVARSLEFAPRLLRAHNGGGGAVERRLRALIESGHRAVWGVPPELRPSMELGASMWRSLWKLSGVKPDATALRQFLREHVPDAGSAEALHGTVWRMARDASFVESPDGQRVDLRSRHVARRMLLRLLEASERSETVDVWSMAEAAWPGERMVPSAVTNRVYVAVSRLRTSGLAELIDHVAGEGGGYRIRPSARLEIV